MLKVEIFDASVQKEWVEKQNKYFYHQEAAVNCGGPYPLVVKVPIPNPDQAHEKGEYSLHHSAFRVGRFGSLEVDPYGIKLIPVHASLKKAG